MGYPPSDIASRPRQALVATLRSALERTLLPPLCGALVALAPHAGRAQTAVPSIDPGMTRDQVLTRLGEPSAESHWGSFTYLLYDNGCGQKCGIDDLVVLERNTVTDAIFRSPRRTFTGASSSPQALTPVSTAHFAPEPIRASSADDSMHRGGIVFMEPRAPLRPPQYVRITPNRADSARLAAGHSGPPAPDSATAPHRR
jgi:hypothetical protein